MDNLMFLISSLHCFLLSHHLVIITSVASFQQLGLENKHLAVEIKSTESHSRSLADISKSEVQPSWSSRATSYRAPPTTQSSRLAHDWGIHYSTVST